LFGEETEIILGYKSAVAVKEYSLNVRGTWGIS